MHGSEGVITSVWRKFMLNKKTLLNVVYAVGLVGTFLTCFGFLNELLNVLQLNGTQVSNLTVFTGETFKEICWVYALAFLVSVLAATVLMLHVFGPLKRKKRTVNVCLILACLLLLALSFSVIFVFRRDAAMPEKYGYSYNLSYTRYMVYYTLRTGIMQFLGNMGIILLCHLIDRRASKVSIVGAAEDNVDEELPRLDFSNRE